MIIRSRATRCQAILLVAALPASAAAQTVSATAGAINGRVADNTGGVSVAAFNLSEQYLGRPTRNLTLNFPDEDNFLNYGNPTIHTERIGAQRTGNMTVVDVRAEKAFRVAARRLAGLFDVYNVANANTATSLGTTSGTSYLRPLDIIAPRVARVGLKLDW
jgi:hypothetical protein